MLGFTPMADGTAKKEQILSVRGWPVKLNTRLKKLAARRGVSIKAILIESAEEYLKNSRNGTKRPEST